MRRPENGKPRQIATLPRTRLPSQNSPENRKLITTAVSEGKQSFKPSKHLVPMSSGKLLSITISRPHKYWGAYIVKGRLVFVYGPRGVGKSHLAMAIAVSMATGHSFLGFKPEKAVRVVILDGEMDLRTLKVRLRRTLAALGAEPTDNLKIVSPEMTTENIPNLNTPSGQAEMEEILGDFDVLIIDNYAAFSSGREDAEAWAPWARWLMKLRRTGRTAILVHHSGKSGQQRGASNHEDAMDAAISVNQPKYAATDGSLQLVIRWEKARHLPLSATRPMLAIYRKDDDGKGTWTKGDVDDVTVDPLQIKAIELHAKGMSQTEIGLKLGKNKSTIGRWLKKTAKDGKADGET
jgi:putative DNA primase/helicase